MAAGEPRVEQTARNHQPYRGGDWSSLTDRTAFCQARAAARNKNQEFKLGRIDSRIGPTAVSITAVDGARSWAMPRLGSQAWDESIAQKQTTAPNLARRRGGSTNGRAAAAGSRPSGTGAVPRDRCSIGMQVGQSWYLSQRHTTSPLLSASQRPSVEPATRLIPGATAGRSKSPVDGAHARAEVGDHACLAGGGLVPRRGGGRPI